MNRPVPIPSSQARAALDGAPARRKAPPHGSALPCEKKRSRPHPGGRAAKPGRGGWMTIYSWRQGGPAAGADQNLRVLVRGRVELPPGEHTLRLSAWGYYHAWLDGAWLGQGPAPAGEGRYYQEYPVEGGRTVTLAVLLCRRAGEEPDGRLGVWAQLVRQGRAWARWDGDWRYQLCRAWDETAQGESFDSRRWPQGWERPRFDSRGWARLVPAGWGAAEPTPQPIAGLCRERVEPAAVRPVPGGVLADFGRELTGTVHAAALGGAGERVTLRFARELDQEGRVRPGSGELGWTLAEGESRLCQHDARTFRYIEALGLEDGRRLMQCWAWERHYPMPQGLCALSCSQDGLERIFQGCKDAVRRACQEDYQPGGEDVIVTARAQVWLTGKTELLRQCVRGLAAQGGGEGVGMALLFPALPLTDYDFTGDREFLWECWPAVQAVSARFSRYQREDGLLENAPWGPEGGGGCQCAPNALWCGFLQRKERMERLLGLPQAGESQRVAAAFLRAFWRWERKLFSDAEGGGRCTLEANAYPACFGLTPSVGADAYERLAEEESAGCGPFLLYFALRGLGRLGKAQALYRLLTREGAGDGGGIWGAGPGSGGAIPLMIEELAGVRPDPERPMGLRFQPRLPAKLEDFALQAPIRGQLARVEQREWRAALTVRPLR